MFKLLKCLIVFFAAVSFLQAQRCPSGTKWDFDTRSCIKIDIQEKLEVVNHKCPNGYSYVNFKNECLTNKRVKEIYDSIRIEYLASPNIPKRKPIPVPEDVPASQPVKTVTAAVVTTVPVETVSQVTNTPVTPQTSNIPLHVSGNEAAEIQGLKNQVTDLQSDVKKLRTELNALKQVAASNIVNAGSRTGTTVNTIYGQEGEIEFQIDCPTSYVWHEDEKICLHQEIYNKKIRMDAGAISAQPITYGPRDVKCPNSWRWHSANNNCIPTVNAMKN